MKIADSLVKILNSKIDIKQALINKGQDVSNRFDTYPNAIRNISGETPKTNCLLFTSKEEMLSTIAEEGQYGVIYTNTQAGVTETSEFDSCTFPETVVLDAPIDDWVELSFVPTDSSSYMDIMGYLERNMMDFSVYTEGSSFRIQYTSNDGITYTRTDTVGNPVEFGTTIKYGNRWGETREFNPVISKFMIVGATYINLIYQYIGNSWIQCQLGLNATEDDVLGNTYISSKGIIEKSLFTTKQSNSANQLMKAINMYNVMNSGSTAADFDDYSNLYQECNTIPNIQYGSPTNTAGMFSNCNNLTSIPNFDTANVTNMAHMFRSCRQIESIPEFNTSNVTDMQHMFYDCVILTTIPNFDTSNVTNMYEMIIGCRKLTAVPNFNTTNVTSMGSMFEYCYNLTSVPNFDTSNVTNMYDMFYLCNNLTSVPNFNTTNVTSMSHMFYGCNKLTTVPNFDTSNVTNIGFLFTNCQNLTTVPNFDTSNVTIMVDMLYNCSNITTVPEFNTPKVTTMASMFSGCNKLTTVPEFNTPKVTSMQGMFSYCNKLSDASIQNIINMILKSNITSPFYLNLSTNNLNSPFCNTNITSARYSNRLSELTAAGWKY